MKNALSPQMVVTRFGGFLAHQEINEEHTTSKMHTGCCSGVAIVGSRILPKENR